jgi:hypothetical protein
MSLPGLIQSCAGARVPGAIAVAAASLVVFAWWRKIKDGRQLALAAACVYGVFFIAAKQAFCNYYYFLCTLLLAAAATSE